jgi:ADP-ribosylglycohydrolase
MASPSKYDRVQGCLLGGAIGDALGAPVEFMSIAQIRREFGPRGIEDLQPAYGKPAAITDDTQMTLFTAEGLLRSETRQRAKGTTHTPSIIHHALMRWLHTQGDFGPLSTASYDGWLIEQRELHSRRAPGNTCLSALSSSRVFGDEADNHSKGCGAVMRVAPIGIVCVDPRAAFDLACATAKTTHGHVSSTLSSGGFAFIVAALMEGTPLPAAVLAARACVAEHAGASETCAAIDRAWASAQSSAEAAPETLEDLGQGWVAEEALALTLFCSLRARDFAHGVLLAVNHSGDSDSTGSMTGQLLGCLGGAQAIPEHWLQQIELRAVISQLADDLADSRAGTAPDERRYPGW